MPLGVVSGRFRGARGQTLVRVHIVAAAHRRLDAAAAGRAFRRGDDGAVVLGHAAGHQIGTAAAAGQAAD